MKQGEVLKREYIKRFFLLGGVGVIVLIILVTLSFVIPQNRNFCVDPREYDLTECVPYIACGTAKTSTINMLAYDFKTNSTKISIMNRGNQDVIAYLYDPQNATNDYIGVMALPPAEKNCFTMLTEARHYRIGIETSSTEYELSVSD